MESHLKVLIPVIITKQLYLPGNILTDEEIDAREKISVFRSVKPSLCDYVSFKQINPANPGNGLSVLFDQPGSPSVFQLITSQLSYKLNWKLTNTGNTSRNKIRLLIVDVDEQRGYEPWDIKGNRIRFISPPPGKTTSGCAIIPGQYLFFLIEDPSKSIDFEITITAFYPKIDRWAVYNTKESNFCVKDVHGNNFHAYTNSKASIGRIQRNIDPCLKSFEDLVIKEYRKNPGLPCTLKKSLSNDLPSVLVTINNGQYIGSKDRNVACGNCYTHLTIVLPKDKPYWIAESAGDSSQFILSSGLYKMDLISAIGTSYRQESFGVPPDQALGIFYGCLPNEENLAFLFCSVNDQNPVRINANSIPPPTVGGDPRIAAMTTVSKVIGELGSKFIRFSVPATEENLLNFTVTFESTHFSFRLNSPVWEVQGIEDGATYGSIRYGAETFDGSVRITKLQ